MTTQIEMMDQKQKKFRRGYIKWLVVFFIAWIGRSVIKIFELEMDLVETILLITLILSVSIQAFYALKENILKWKSYQDPLLKEALNDELVQLNELKAWRTAFFALIAYVLLAAVFSLFITFNDPMLIYITALLVGFGSFNTAVYFLNR